MFLDFEFNEAKKICIALNEGCAAIIKAGTGTQVKAIADAFPNGDAIDSSCVIIATDAKNATAAVLAALPKAQAAVDGIYAKMQADITQIKHNNPKHGVGFYLSVVGAVAEDLAADL
jgi:hypothetical protein